MKNQRLLDQGKTQDFIEKRYRISHRVDAEETTLETASFMVASTSQEVEQQYAGYDNYQPNRMMVIPPGMDLSRFRPPQRSWSEYRRILAERPSDWQAVAEDAADRRARAHYYRHIETQLADVTEKLARLRAMGAGDTGR